MGSRWSSLFLLLFLFCLLEHLVESCGPKIQPESEKKKSKGGDEDISFFRLENKHYVGSPGVQRIGYLAAASTNRQPVATPPEQFSCGNKKIPMTSVCPIRIICNGAGKKIETVMHLRPQNGNSDAWCEKKNGETSVTFFHKRSDLGKLLEGEKWDDLYAFLFFYPPGSCEQMDRECLFKQHKNYAKEESSCVKEFLTTKSFNGSCDFVKEIRRDICEKIGEKCEWEDDPKGNQKERDKGMKKPGGEGVDSTAPTSTSSTTLPRHLEEERYIEIVDHFVSEESEAQYSRQIEEKREKAKEKRSSSKEKYERENAVCPELFIISLLLTFVFLFLLFLLFFDSCGGKPEEVGEQVVTEAKNAMSSVMGTVGDHPPSSVLSVQKPSVLSVQKPSVQVKVV